MREKGLENGLEKGSVSSFSPFAQTPKQRHHLAGLRVLHVPFPLVPFLPPREPLPAQVLRFGCSVELHTQGPVGLDLQSLQDIPCRTSLPSPGWHNPSKAPKLATGAFGRRRVRSLIFRRSCGV